jgi:hypothetical protein
VRCQEEKKDRMSAACVGWAELAKANGEAVFAKERSFSSAPDQPSLRFAAGESSRQRQWKEVRKVPRSNYPSSLIPEASTRTGKEKSMKWMRFVWVLLICLFALTAFAQQPSQGTMDSVRDSLKAQKRAFVAVNMKLTDAEDPKFWPVYDSYQKDLDKIYERMAAMIVDYARNYDTLTDGKANQLLITNLALEGDLLKLGESYLAKFSAVLPQKKVARYYQLENKIQAVIRYDLADQIPLVK